MTMKANRKEYPRRKLTQRQYSEMAQMLSDLTADGLTRLAQKVYEMDLQTLRREVRFYAHEASRAAEALRRAHGSVGSSQ